MWTQQKIWTEFSSTTETVCNVNETVTEHTEPYFNPASVTTHSDFANLMEGGGDTAGDGGSCFKTNTGVDDLLSVPLPLSDMTGVGGAIAGDIERAGFATAMILPPLDAITCAVNEFVSSGHVNY